MSGRRHAGHAPGALACRFDLTIVVARDKRSTNRNHGVTSSGPLSGDWHYGCLLLSLCPNLPSTIKSGRWRQGCRQVQRHAQGSQP